MNAPDRIRLVVGIATAGRRDALSETLRQLGLQTRVADEVVISPAKPDDLDLSVLAHLPFRTRVVSGPSGLPNQRNTILRNIPEADAVVFYDDDFYPAPDYLAHVESLLAVHPEAVGLTGTVLADGKLTRGISREEALQILALDAQRTPLEAPSVQEIYSLYGANMVVRLAPVRRHGLLFDSNLPLYGWLEDLDFTRQLAAHGQILECQALRGVHLALKTGRTSGLKFGYSQIANPLYLVRKGTMSPRRALAQSSRNLARNLQRSVWRPEPWIDRTGRLKGNLTALADLLRGQVHPTRITALS